MSRSVHVPAGIFDSRDYGFAQVAIIPTLFGYAVHVSGQVAWDADRNIVGAGDIGRQLDKSLETLAVALASVGAKLDHTNGVGRIAAGTIEQLVARAAHHAAPDRPNAAVPGVPDLRG